MRTFAIGAAAIALLAVVCVGLIALLPGAPLSTRPPPAAATPGLETAPPPPAGAVAPAAVASAQPLVPTPPPPVPAIVIPRPPPPPADSWEAVAPVSRPSALGPVGAAIGRELLALQPRVSACFDEVTQARFGRTAFTEVQDYAPMDDNGTTVLMLEVETRAGAATIVDAPVETRGNASDGLIACAQRVLRGHAFEIAAAKAGGRHRIVFPLQP